MSEQEVLTWAATYRVKDHPTIDRTVALRQTSAQALDTIFHHAVRAVTHGRDVLVEIQVATPEEGEDGWRCKSMGDGTAYNLATELSPDGTQAILVAPVEIGGVFFEIIAVAEKITPDTLLAELNTLLGGE